MITDPTAAETRWPFTNRKRSHDNHRPAPDGRGRRQHKRQVRAFQTHAAVAAGTLTLILAVNLLTNLSTGTAGDFSAWRSLWALVGWIPGLGVHGLVWLTRPRSRRHDRLAVR